jgi:peptide/nickel transport system permease protein
MNWLTHGGIAAFIARRLLLGVLVLFLVSVLVFVSTQALGDPARAILGRNATPEALAALQRQLNLDQSVLGQYLSWIGGLLQGSLGTSLATQQSASELLGPRLVNSTVLVFLAAAISIPISVALGAWSALRREKVFDNVSSNLMLVLAALPEFVVALGLVILFATTVFHWLPAISSRSP